MTFYFSSLFINFLINFLIDFLIDFLDAYIKEVATRTPPWLTCTPP